MKGKMPDARNKLVIKTAQRTNGDAIRDMSDEELANFLALQQIGVVTEFYKAFDVPVPDAMTGAREEWLNWLRKEAGQDAGDGP